MTSEILKQTPIRSTHYSREKCGFVCWGFFILKSTFLTNTKKFSLCCLHTLPSIHPKYVPLHRDNTQSDFPTFHFIPNTITCFHKAPRVPPHPCMSVLQESLQGDRGHRTPVPPLTVIYRSSGPARTTWTVSHLHNGNAAIRVWLLCFVCLKKVTPSG